MACSDLTDAALAAAETRRFLDGYGDTTVDPLALSYYRHARAVQDIAGYGKRILSDQRCGDESRADAARILVGLLGAGEIVELARESVAPF
jgi:hypothetical protein